MWSAAKEALTTFSNPMVAASRLVSLPPPHSPTHQLSLEKQGKWGKRGEVGGNRGQHVELGGKRGKTG